MSNLNWNDYSYQITGFRPGQPKQQTEKQRLKAHRSALSAKATEAAIAEWHALPQEERDRRLAAAHTPQRKSAMTAEAKAYLEAQQAEDLRQLKARDAAKAYLEAQQAEDMRQLLARNADTTP